MQTLPPMVALMLNLQDSESHERTSKIITAQASTLSADDVVICHLKAVGLVQKKTCYCFSENAMRNSARGEIHWSGLPAFKSFVCVSR